MLQGKHSAIFSTFIKLPFVIKTFVLSIFEWLLKTGFNGYIYPPLTHNTHRFFKDPEPWRENLLQMTISNFAPFPKIANKAWYFMRIVCWQTILMKYHALFLSKTRKDVAKYTLFLPKKLEKMSQNLLSAAVVIGALRFNAQSIFMQVLI